MLLTLFSERAFKFEGNGHTAVRCKSKIRISVNLQTNLFGGRYLKLGWKVLFYNQI